MTLVIDCHGHYTTAPPQHDEWRSAQVEAYKNGTAAPAYPTITDDEIRETIESNQLKLIKERGADVTIFSPRASRMAPHVGDQAVSEAWSQHCNNLIYRVTQLYPETFVGVCQLPQSPKADMSASIKELRRCVEELGFVGCNLNPDPAGGHFTHPPLTDEYWFPFYEAMCELNVPAMIHVSGSCNPAMHATGGYYLAADTVAFMQLMEGDLFSRFPNLRMIIPHGGGAVPFHWGRYRGLADMLKKPSLDEYIMTNVFFDTCVYHQPGVNLLADVIENKNILFGSEMVGAVRGIDPTTGQYFDDTKRYVDALDITDAERAAIFEGNARRVYPRLDAILKERGL
ncbi:amidohydrolase family protein [Altericroceibacterium endophyticum]|uniref:Amidohydrolase family protein n=1 Tax=Altericroceibacterium endophyticum TaxID=1808508 RepID=A0A6I4T2D3_9SPHN|nr:amidohydrolase family protein [Altericroceibacterium endophyticum]MXO65374.1 amidohydrolase family protein [Altericroceibacterium endophyticum]